MTKRELKKYIKRKESEIKDMSFCLSVKMFDLKAAKKELRKREKERNESRFSS